MRAKNPYLDDLLRGIGRDNPVFRLVLGLCPFLAITTTAKNALGMGAAVIFVLLGSNVIISLVRRFIPREVRIPCFIVIIATFVTIVDLVMSAYFPPLRESLGIFVPLIVVNCIILGRAEAFASRMPVGRAITDAIGIGIGFTLALLLISVVREALGSGQLYGYYLFGRPVNAALMMILPPGAFIAMGVLLGFFNWLSKR
ncbi:MAG TPA: electron transport complex subunit E [Armatimonadetes bacterium]|nr:electron transport complex subunit E [Armatimonadota bacterium]